MKTMTDHSAHDHRELLAQTAWVRRLAISLTSTPSEADDLVQEAWLAALQKPPAEGGSFQAWLRVVLQNLSARAARSRIRRSDRERDVARSEHLCATADVVERAATHRELVGVVMELEEPYRTAILLRYFEGLPPRSIASQMKMPVRTVHTHLSRGLAMLRARLDSEHGGRTSWLSGLLALSSERPRLGPRLDWVHIMNMKLLSGMVAACALSMLGVYLVMHGPFSGGERVLDGRTGSMVDSMELPLEQDLAAETDHLPLVRPSQAASRTSSDRALPHPIDHDRDLHGHVTNRLGEAIGGARVQVTSCMARQFSSLAPADGAPRVGVLLETLTDQHGDFRLRLEPGRRVDLRVEAEGYATETAINLYSGEQADITLGRGGSLHGQITSAVDGNPIEGARIATSRIDRQARGVAKVVTFTDIAGFYRLEDLPAGFYDVTITSPLGKTRGLPVMEVFGDKQTRADVALKPGTLIRGRVIDKVSGQAIAGALVASGTRLLRGVRTDAEGLYEITDDGPTWSPILIASREGYGRWERRVVTTPGADLTLNFELLPARRAHGRVVAADGTPVSGAEVVAMARVGPPTEPMFRTDWSSTTSGDDGYFELANLRPDLAHVLTLRKEGLGTAIFNFPEDEMELTTIELGSVPLYPPSLVAGIVLDAEGAPVPDLHVSLFFQPANMNALRLKPMNGEGMSFARSPANARTDQRGRFFFPDLPPGDYEVVVGAKGLVGSARISLDLAEGETRDDLLLSIDLGGAIAGVVVDPDGLPVRSAYVTLTPPGTGPWSQVTNSTTDAEGRFALRGLDEGEFDLYVQDLWYSTAYGDEGTPAVADMVRRGVAVGSTDLRLQMPRAGVIAGRVLRPDGQPAEDCWISPEGQIVGGPVRAGPDGHFRFIVSEGAVITLRIYGPSVDASGSGEFGDGSNSRRMVVLQASAGERDLIVQLVEPQ